MSQEKPLVAQEAPLRSLKKLLLAEVEGDIRIFPEEVRRDVLRLLGDFSLTSQGQSRAYKELNDWWSEKYQFPFSLVAARQEVLRRKYGLTLEQQQTLDLQKSLWKPL